MPDLEHKTTCPNCGYRQDSVTLIDGDDGAVPKEGDISFCVGCGMFAIFEVAAPGGMRQMTKLEWVELNIEVDVPKIIAVWEASKLLARLEGGKYDG